MIWECETNGERLLFQHEWKKLKLNLISFGIKIGRKTENREEAGLMLSFLKKENVIDYITGTKT